MGKTARTLAALLACASFLTACGARERSAAAAAVTAPGELPVVKEKVTLTGFIPSVGFIEDLRTNAAAQWLEQATNVHVEWMETTKADAKNKLGVLLASGDYPDILSGTGANGAGLSNQDIYRYGTQGVFLALNDLIETQGHHIKELFRTEPLVKPAVTSPNGRIYGLPAVFTDDYHITMRQKLWINKAWLDRLGLRMPADTDEFYAVARAFKERDPNGNGVKDEIPLTGAKRSQEDLALWIMNAFVAAGGPDDSGDALLNNYEFVFQDNVFFGADKPEFREGLRYLARLFREGLIDVAAFTQDKEQIKPLVDGGAANRIGAAASHHPGNFANTADPKERYKEYVAQVPIKGPRGNRTTAWIIDQVIQPGQLEITDRCRQPAVAMRWADNFYSLEFGLREKGVQGTHWDKVDPGENLIGYTGKPALYRYLKVLTKEDNAQINLGPGWTRNLKNEFAKGAGYSYEEMLYTQTTRYEPFKLRRFPYATASVKEASMNEFNDLRRTIHTFIAESTDRFIIGDKDIETQWDAYVAQLGQIGLDRYLSILRETLTGSR